MASSSKLKTKDVKEEVKVVKKKVVKSTNVKKDVVKTRSTASISAPVYDVKGAKDGTLTLPKEVFGAKINQALMAQAVRVYLANQRQGNAHTKTRGEIDLTKKKWFRQKGTGRARHGAQSAPIFVGGGVAHGPKAHDFSLTMPQKMKKAALFSALSLKAKDGEITVLSGFTKITPKTKVMAGVINKITADPKRKSKILLVTNAAPKEISNVYQASRNIKNLNIMNANLLNTYEVLKYKNVFLMKESVEVLGGSK